MPNPTKQSPVEESLAAAAGAAHPTARSTPAPVETARENHLAQRPFRRIDAKELPKEFVITPGGPHHRSLVQIVEPGHVLDMTNGAWRVMDHNQQVIRELTPLAPPPPGTAYLGSGWIASSSSFPVAASPLSFISTTWTVPPPPRTDSGQLLYLFNGFQVTVTSTDPTRSGLHILQPVLQWGTSPDGGGPSWAIASWFAGNSSQPAQQTPLTSVNPGTTLTGTITLTSNAFGVLTYVCQFAGFPNSQLTVNLSDLPFQVVETLEVYTVQQASDFPNTNVTRMRNIAVNAGRTAPALNWTVSNAAVDSGQYALVANSNNPNGEVDLFYGYSLDLVNKVTLDDTSNTAPALASQNGKAFIAFKGSGNDNLNVMLSADNGSTWGGKMTSPESCDESPALAAHNGLLCIAWKGSGNENINIAQVPLVQNGGSYSIQSFASKVTLGETTDNSPALASHNGLLFLAWRGSGNDNLNVMLSADNGSTWGGKMTSPESSDDRPALCSHNGRLYIAWQGSGNPQLNVAQVPFAFGNNQWSIGQFTNKTILADASDAGPALTSSAGQLFLAWRGSGNNNLSVMLSPDDGATFSGKSIYGEASDLPPALAAHNGRLLLGWKGSGNDNLNVAQAALDQDLTLLPWEENLTGPSGALAVAHQSLANQLDLVAVNSTGSVAVSWVNAEQAWNGPQPLTPAGFAPARAPVALAHQTSFHQLDALVVNGDGQVCVLWVTDDAAWQGPAALTAPRYARPGTHIALAHQTALNQLDALFIDASGAVNVLFVVEENAWSQPVRLTGPVAPAGAPIALAHQTSTYQLDALFVDAAGAINVMWVVGEGAWAGPVPLTTQGYAVPNTHIVLAHQTDYNQLDAFFVDSTGALNVLWVTGEAAWSNPVRLTADGFAPPGAPVAAAHQSSMDQLDVFVVDSKGAVNVLWVVQEGAWNGPVALTGNGFSTPGGPVAAAHQTSIGQLDLFVTDANGSIQVLWVGGEGAWQGPAPLPGPFTV